MTTEAIKLQYPVKVDGVETDTLHLRRLTVADLEIVDSIKSELEKSIRMLSLVASMPVEAVKAMDVEDFQKVSEKIIGFLG